MAFLLTAFETINNCRVTVDMEAVDTRGAADLNLRLVAYRRNLPEVEANCLGLVSVTCSATMTKGLEAALTHALYLLDAKMAAGEFVATLSK